MRRLKTVEGVWAAGELGAVRLGDARRSARLELILARAAERPAGKLAEVIENSAELQGAYDLLEGDRVSPQALLASFAAATLERAIGERWIYAVVDGTSVHVTDLTCTKGTGSLGALRDGGRGMKVINTLGVDGRGVTIGLIGQVWWARTGARRDSANKRKRNGRRALNDKETGRWVEAIRYAKEAANQRGVRLWYQIDREGDNRDLLLALAETGHDFTVRSAWDRVIEATGEDEQHLRQRLANQTTSGTYDVEVIGAPRRSPRTARMVVRTATVTLTMRQYARREFVPLTVNVVWAHEEGSTPTGEKPLDWVLLTTRPIGTFGQAYEVIYGYTQRWRIEDFHRAWKSSVCRVEDIQLRSANAIIVWAVLLANVAARAERLRLLAQKQGHVPATSELSDVEVRALILLKRKRKKRNEVIPNSMPTIAQATLWIAQLGGYTGKSSGGPPGAITIRRGLEPLAPAAEMLAIIEAGER